MEMGGPTSEPGPALSQSASGLILHLTYWYIVNSTYDSVSTQTKDGKRALQKCQWFNLTSCIYWYIVSTTYDSVSTKTKDGNGEIRSLKVPVVSSYTHIYWYLRLSLDPDERRGRALSQKCQLLPGARAGNTFSRQTSGCITFPDKHEC